MDHGDRLGKLVLASGNEGKLLRVTGGQVALHIDVLVRVCGGREAHFIRAAKVNPHAVA